MINRRADSCVSITRIAAVLAAMFFSSPLFAVDPQIDLHVGEVNGQQKLLFDNSACSTGQPGCVDVARGSKVWIMWELDNASHRDGWDLSGLRLSWAEDVPTDCVIADFNVDPQTGEALAFRVQGNGQRAMNRDENDCDTPYEVNYTISATHRTLDMTIDSDPVIRNGGNN